MKWILVALIILAPFQSNANPSSQQIFLDDKNNIHIILSSRNDTLLTRNGRSDRLKVTKDGRVAAWLEGEKNIPDDNEKIYSNLIIYENGKKRSITCQPIIRDFWFWQMGNRLAIDCGSRHFAGREYLYDVKTLKVIDSFDQGSVPMEERPNWSESSDHFEDE